MAYLLKTPVSAILDKPNGGQVSVKIPAGAILRDSPAHSTTLFGMIGVTWEGRHYWVARNALLKQADCVETA